MKINSDHAKRKENHCIESMLCVTLGWVCQMCEPASHASHSASHASQASQDVSHDFNARKCFLKHVVEQYK